MTGREKGAPGLVRPGPGAVVQGTEGSRLRGEVVVVIFLTMDELRRCGPLQLRPWLERRMRSLKRGPGTVVQFRAPHQEARSKGGGGS